VTHRRGGALGAALALLLLLGTTPPAAADHNPHPGGNGGKGAPPNAVGVDSHSRTYVGFMKSSGLVRLAASGKRLKAWPLEGTGPVTALDVTRHDRVWITDGRTARLIGRDGTQEKAFQHGPEDGCAETKGQRGSRYGGIESYAKLVFVANRCAKTVQVFRRNGDPVATLPVPGRGYPRGLAYQERIGKLQARLYVAFPDRGRVLVFGAKAWKDGEDPILKLGIRRPYRGHRTQPTGIVADRFGQVVVSDLANNALYFYDSRHRYSRYRVLGYPPRPGSRAGHLHRPTALAQHRQDRSRSAGALVIADTGNHRVQRWNTYGYTYWARRVGLPRG
jgi:streptogramin lyase